MSVRASAKPLPATLRRARAARAAAWLAAGALLLGAGACSSLGGSTGTSAAANRPEGEGYAGVGELLVRIGVHPEASGLVDSFSPRKPERGFVEIRYQGLDSLGRAVFERHDADAFAEGAPAASLPTSARGTALVPAPAAPEAGGNSAPAAPNTREIALDLRFTRQLRVQGKIIEVIEATASGVVFHLY